MLARRHLVTSSALLALIVLLAGCGKKGAQADKSNAPDATPTPGATPTGTPAPGTAPPVVKVPKNPDYKLEATALLEELTKDRKGTEAKYGGKVLEVNGVARAPATGHGPGAMFMLGSPTRVDLNPFICITDDTSLVGNIGAWQTLRVREIFNGRGGTLDHCEVVEKGPDTILRVTAEELARDFTTSRPQASIKYNEKTLILTGTVSDFKTTSPKSRDAVLKGDGKTSIECTYSNPASTAKLKVGDSVKLICSVTNSGNGVVKVEFGYPLSP
jgi:predicted small lipoprotein YifL